MSTPGLPAAAVGLDGDGGQGAGFAGLDVGDVDGGKAHGDVLAGDGARARLLGVDRLAPARAQLEVPGDQLAAGGVDADVEALLRAAEQDVGGHRRADAGAPGGDLGGIVDAVVAAHVLELGPDGPFLGGGVVVDKGLEPLGLRRVLDVAEVGAVDVFHDVGGAVGHRGGKDGLAGGELDFERHADVEGAAQLGGDALPRKAGAAGRRARVRGS